MNLILGRASFSDGGPRRPNRTVAGNSAIVDQLNANGHAGARPYRRTDRQEPIPTEKNPSRGRGTGFRNVFFETVRINSPFRPCPAYHQEDLLPVYLSPAIR